MNLLLLALALCLGVALSLWPNFLRKFTVFFDTVIHEAGHGLSSLPFGAPLPSITVRKNTSGETLSSMGYLHQMLPLGLGFLTEKVARVLNLLSGYTASTLLGSFLIVLSLNGSLTFSPWLVLFLAQVGLATFLWTVVKLTDNPWIFLGSLAVVSLVVLLVLGLSLWIYLASLCALIVLFFLARTWLSTLAAALSLTSAVTFVGGALLSLNGEIAAFYADHGITLDSRKLSEAIFVFLLVFILLCCRSLLSAVLTLAMFLPPLAVLYFELLGYELVLAFLAGVLYCSGVRSFVELWGITTKSRSHWSDREVETDMVFASREIGGSPRLWYVLTACFGVLGSFGILLFGVFG